MKSYTPAFVDNSEGTSHRQCLFIKVCCIVILFVLGLTASAQTPKWNWAKGVGSNGQDDVSAINLDSVGNIYEIINIPGQSITLGGHTFTNPHPWTQSSQGVTISIFVKYDTQGNVVWAKAFPSQGGYFLNPSLMCTDRHGNSYVYYGYFQDSITLDGITVRDTGAASGFWIAKYDPNGNVVSIHVKPTNSFYSSNTSIISMQPWDGGHLLVMGLQSNAPDTVDGFALPNGSFLAIMDTAATFQRVKYLGHDTTPFGNSTLIQPIFNLYGAGGHHICANDNKTVYLNFAANYKTVFDTSMPIVIPGVSPTNTPDILIKLDSSFNYQWHVTNGSNVYASMVACDQFDNAYLAGAGSGYYLIKIDPNGNQLWNDGFVNASPFNGSVQGIFTDRLGNAYMGGTYDSYLIAGSDSLMDPENLFVVKTYPDGQVAWAQGTNNAVHRLGSNSFAADEHGNVYINGLYYYTGQPGFGRGNPILGHDTLIGFTPANGYPIAPDVFTARLGACNPLPPTLSASSPLNWCGHDSVTLTSSAAHSYLWNTGDTTHSITTDSSGKYSVYAIDTLGCYAQSLMSMVSANPQPIFSASVTKNVSCFNDTNGQIILSATGGSQPYTYQSTPTVASYQSVGAGTYYISLTDSNGCTAMDTVTVTQPATPLNVQVDTIHDGAAVQVSGATPPYTYQWSNSLTSDTITQLQTGWYTVTVTDINNCLATDSVYVDNVDGIGSIRSANTIKIYPNPTSNIMSVQALAGGNLEAYNMAGNVVYRQALKPGKSIIDISTWPNGIYQIGITNNGIKSYMNKLTVIHP